MTLWWGTQNCAQHLKCSLISAKYRGTVIYPVGHMVSEASWDAINQLGHLGTELAQLQPTVDQHPQGLFLWAPFQLLYPKPIWLHVMAVTQAQNPALSFDECHVVGHGPSIQPIQIPLQSLPTIKTITSSFCLFYINLVKTSHVQAKIVLHKSK